MESLYRLIVKFVRAIGRWLYAIFASAKTSVYLAGVLTVFFVIGTIFPQGREYAGEGGFGLKLAKFFHVLDVFTSPLFLLVVALFFVNLTVFLIDLFRGLRMHAEEKPFDEESFPEKPGIIKTDLSSELQDPAGSIKGTLKDLGFKLKSFLPHSSLARGVAHRGISFRWLSFISHLAVWLLLVGFLISYMSAFEGEVVIFPGEREFIPTRSQETRLNKLLSMLGMERKAAEDDGFRLELERFITEYVQFPRLNYPKGVKGRVALALGLHPEKLRYTLAEKDLFPKDWKSVLTVYENGKAVRSESVEVNRPLRHRGMTFYQAFYSQELKISVEETGEIYDVRTGEPFKIREVDGLFEVGTLRLGTLYGKDGSMQEITPFARVSYIPDPEDRSSDREIGRLVIGETLHDNGITLRMESFREGTGLTYRKDPGRPILYASAYVFVIAFLIRIFAPWYLIQYMVRREDEGLVMYVRGSSGGFLADWKRMSGKLMERIQARETPQVIEADVETIDHPVSAEDEEGSTEDLRS